MWSAGDREINHMYQLFSVSVCRVQQQFWSNASSVDEFLRHYIFLATINLGCAQRIPTIKCVGGGGSNLMDHPLDTPLLYSTDVCSRTERNQSIIDWTAEKSDSLRERTRFQSEHIELAYLTRQESEERKTKTTITSEKADLEFKERRGVSTVNKQ